MSKTSSQSKRRPPVAQATAARDPLLQAWEKRLRENHNRAAILDQHGNVARTFFGVEERARELASELIEFEPGEVIAIQIGNHPDWPSLFLACLRKRVVVLPLEQTLSVEQRRTVLQTCGVVAAAIVGGKGLELKRILPVRRAEATPATFSRVKARDRRQISFQFPPRDPSTALRSVRDDWKKHQPSVLKLTSGTTAAPRAIRFRSEQLLADCENICDTMDITARDVNFGVISISHSYGFSNLLTPLLARGVPLALSSDRMPLAILHGIAATRATVFPGMPIFYQSFCELGHVPPLPELRLCISAGAPLSAQLAEAFRGRFGLDIHSFYGSSECGGICYAREPNPLPGFVGPPMHGVKIEPLDVRSASSLIHVRGRAVGDGYFPQSDEAKLGGGIFIPDDLLEKTPTGYRIVGRASDLINVAGKKVSPAEVEAQIVRCPGVREAVVFAGESPRRNQEVIACVVVAAGHTEAQLLAHCRARLSACQMPRRIFLVDRIPVNERGKVNRRELARRYAAIS
jgi:long-chain acyl-CoA synthetase